MDTKRDIYGDPLAFTDTNGDPLAYPYKLRNVLYEHSHTQPDGYIRTHAHPYAVAHEHPDTAFNPVRPADADAV